MHVEQIYKLARDIEKTNLTCKLNKY